MTVSTHYPFWMLRLAPAVLAVFLPSTSAYAQTLLPSVPEAPVVVALEPGAVNAPDAAVREAISRELGVPALEPEQAPAAPVRGRLTIVLDASRRLVLTFLDSQGREVIRVVARSDDPTAMIATIALLAGNLARNQVDELLAPPALTPAAVPLPEAPPLAAPAPPKPPAIPLAPPSYDWRAARERRRFSFGFDGYFGALRSLLPATPGGNASTRVSLLVNDGFYFGVALTPNVVLGLNHLGFGGEGGADGTPRWWINSGPYVELRTLIGPVVQPFAQVGVPFQVRVGGGLETDFGVAVYAGGGLRLRLGERFSIALGGRGYVVATPGFEMGMALMPRGALALTGGLELGLHF